MHASELWTSQTAFAKLARAILTPASWLYSAGWEVYLGLYRLGVKLAASPHCPIIVVGNLSIGGSGKTPATLAIAKLLRSMGHEVVIGCSGYGSRRAEAATIAPEGPLDPAEWGDEPAMIRWLAADLPVVVGRRRVLAAQLVHTAYPGAILLMDDGFQHLPLRKHVSIVLDDPNAPNVRCLPAGPYREPRKELGRADVVIASPASQDGFGLDRRPNDYVDPSGNPIPIRRATALCALARPDRLLSDLRKDLELVSPLVVSDHDPLTSGTLLDCLPPDLPVVVTAKDWVKLRVRSDVLSREFVIAIQEASIEPQEEFKQWLAEKLNESRC